MKALNILTTILLIVGGLNWGLVGVAKFDLVATLFGWAPLLQAAVYTLVGISALYQIFTWRKMRSTEAQPAWAEVRS